jgi:hypothetical protein
MITSEISKRAPDDDDIGVICRVPMCANISHRVENFNARQSRATPVIARDYRAQ